MTSPDEVGQGAMLAFGFGSGPGDEVTIWSAETGELTGGTYTFDAGSAEQSQIPAASAWSLVALAILLLAAGMIVLQ